MIVMALKFHGERMSKESDKEQCCGAYCSEAGCCPFPKEDD